MKISLILCLLISLPLLSACAPPTPAPPETRPDDFRVQYQWWAGSMPPPYYYEYRLEIEPGGSGWIILTPDYPAEQVPTYTENFSLTPGQMDDLYASLVSHGLFRQDFHPEPDPPVGGSTSLLTAAAGGREVLVYSYTVERQRQQAEALAETVRGAVPQEVWDRLEQKRQEYMQGGG